MVKHMHSPVILKDLKPIDVQDSNDCVLPMNPGVIVFNLNDIIDSSHNPTEKPLINGL